MIFVLFAGGDRVLAQVRAEVRAGHSAEVTQVVFAPDGRTFASASKDGTIRIWDVATNSEIRALSGHTNIVIAIAYSPDGRYLVSASTDETVKIWVPLSGELVRTIQGEKEKDFLGVAVMPDSRTLVTSGINAIRFWSIENGAQLHSVSALEGYYWSFTLSPDGHLAALRGEHDIAVFDLASGRALRKFGVGDKCCTAVALSADGEQIVFATGDFSVEIHDMRNGGLTRKLEAEGRSMLALAFSPDGQMLSGTDQYLNQWDLRTGARVKRKYLSGGIYSAIAYSPDGKTLALGNMGGAIATIHALDFREVETKKPASPYEFESNFALDPTFRKADDKTLEISGAAFSPDGSALATIVKDKNEIGLLDLATGKVTNHPVSIKFPGFIGYSADGKRIVVAGMEGAAVLDAHSFTELHRFRPSIINAALSSDGRYLASAFPNGSAILLDLDSASEHVFDLLRRDFQSTFAFAFSPDGKTLVAGGKGKFLTLWDLDRKKMTELPTEQEWVNLLAISPDGRWLASGDYWGGILLFDLKSKAKPVVFRKQGGKLYRLAFANDSRSLITVEDGEGGVVVFRSLSDGREVHRAWGGGRGTGDMIINPKGQGFATLGHDVVDIRNTEGQILATLYRLKDGSSVMMTPEGYYDASSASAEEGVNLRVQGALVPLASYREKFFRPDLVLASLTGHSLRGLPTISETKPAPLVEILPMPPSTDHQETRVRLRIVDNAGGLGQIRVFLNGSSVVYDESETRGPGMRGEIERSYVVPLAPGMNSLQAVVFNADNSAQKKSSQVQVESAVRQAKPPALYAVVIGIQTFRNSRFDLQFSEADAQLFARTLRDHALGLYSQVTTDVLTKPEETTRDAVIAALKKARTKVGPDDLFVFFVASHGVADEGDYFLVTSNVGSPSTERLKVDALDQKQLTGLIANIPSTKKFIVIDTCQAAALGDSLSAVLMTRGMSDITAAKILSRAVGSTVLTAATSEQQAIEGFEGHGLFSYVIAEGLSGKADLNHDGYVTTIELANYVEEQVPAIAEKLFKHAQYPVNNPTGNNFPIARVQ